jgi:multiple sugar transport system substrate-binding protein
MKKLFAFIMVLTVLLSACGTQQTQQTAVKGTPVVQDEPVEISYMMWGSPEELAVWEQIVADFEAAHPNIKVKVDVSDWDGYWEKLKVLFASETPPDVFAMDAPLFPDWQGRGVLLNLQPYIDASPGFLDDFYPVTLTNYKLPDGYYGLPRDFQTIVIYYNKDMFDAAGLPYPKAEWTLEDMRQTAIKLTKDTNGDGAIDQWGLGTDLWDMELFWSEVIWSYGGEIINADRTKTLLGEGPARDAWQFIADLILVDGCMPDPDTATQYGYDLFQAGVVAMWPMGHWALPDYLGVDFKFDVVAFPTGPVSKATSVNSAGYVISKNSEHPQEAWELVKYALGPEGQKRLTELGLAIPTIKSVAENPIFLSQQTAPINQQVFLDSLAFAHVKPAFKGYDEWASVVGDGLFPVWNGDADLNETLDAIVPAADEVLSRNK